MVRGHQRKAPTVKQERQRWMARTKVEAAVDVWSCKARRGGVPGDLKKIPVIARCWIISGRCMLNVSRRSRKNAYAFSILLSV